MLNKYILMLFKKIFFLCFFSFFNNIILSKNYVTNERGVQLGDALINFSLAKILALKYSPNLELHYTPFIYSDLFVLDICEKKIDPNFIFSEIIYINNEQNIINNINKQNVLFVTNIRTKIDYINELYINILKEVITLKKIPENLNIVPNNIITVAVHIRKGNGGGLLFDGEQYSLQLYDHDISEILYINNYFNYPFDWESYIRIGDITESVILSNYKDYASNWEFLGKPVDTVDYWQTKFPPEQYYVDQIKKLSQDLNNKNLFVQIFTDDKNPLELVERIKNAVNLNNIIFYYKNNRNLVFADQTIQDLYNISRFNVLIRSQSYFARIAELIGSHKLVIYPLEFKWEGKKLIMNKIVIKGKFGIY